MDEFLEIIKKFKLEYYLNVILTNNTGNTNLYHNFYHTQCVTTNCYKIAIDTDTYEENDIKILLIAALFHDFNHSGGKLKNDSENVKLAIEGFQKYTKESKEDTEFICDLIKITEFPYNADNDSKLSIRQQILRDADVMQWLEPNFIQQIIFGLFDELEFDSDLNKRISAQITFMNSLELFTKYGQNIVKQKIKKVIEDLNYIINITNK